jgi:hypothetical protein
VKNCFYVEIAGSPYLFEKTVVVVGEHKFCAFYADSGHPVADEKSRGGWSWRLGGLRSLPRCRQLKKSTVVRSVAFLTHSSKSPQCCRMCRVIMHLCDFLLSTGCDEMTKMTNCCQKTPWPVLSCTGGSVCHPGARCLLPWWWAPATPHPVDLEVVGRASPC